MAKSAPCLTKSSSSPNLNSQNLARNNSSSNLSSASSQSLQPRVRTCLPKPVSEEQIVKLAESSSKSQQEHRLSATFLDREVPASKQSTKSRRSILSSIAAAAPVVVKKAANYSAESTAIWFGTSELVWPIDEKTLCHLAETCVKTRTAVGISRNANMFFVHHLLQNVVSFYENLFNSDIDKDHFVLRLIYQHVVAVIEHIKATDACTEDALKNFDKMKKAMECELDMIYSNCYDYGQRV